MPNRNISFAGTSEVLVASAARTTSGDSGTLTGWGAMSHLVVQLDVTAAAGVTPTLAVVVEDSVDGTNWNQVAAFAQKTVAAREVVRVTPPFTDKLRVRWTVGGTSPSFTFSVWAYSE